MLAALAVGYIAVLLMQPQWAGPLTTQALRTESPAPDVSPAVQQITAEVGTLRRTVADLQREVAYVKSTTALQQETIESLRSASPDPELARLEPEPPLRIAAAEGQPDTARAKQSDAAQAKAKPEDSPRAKASEADAIRAKADKAAAPAAKTRPTETAAASPERTQRDEPKARSNAVTEAPAERKKVVVLNAQPTEKSAQPESIETGSLPSAPAPEITFGPPIVTPAAEPVGIHLDAGPSIDALRLKWSMLHHRHSSVLGDLEPRFLIAGTAGSPSFQLMAGPISSAEEASRLCALLRAKRVACSVGGPFVGQAL
jgi:phage-related minor tail protein